MSKPKLAINVDTLVINVEFLSFVNIHWVGPLMSTQK